MVVLLETIGAVSGAQLTHQQQPLRQQDAPQNPDGTCTCVEYTCTMYMTCQVSGCNNVYMYMCTLIVLKYITCTCI